MKVFPSLLPLHFTVHQRSLTERLNLKVHLSHKPNNEGGKGGRGYTKYGLSGLSLMFTNDDVYLYQSFLLSLTGKAIGSLIYQTLQP